MLPPAFEARPSRRRILVLLVGCALLVAASIFILVYPERLPRFRNTAWFAALVGLPLFALGGLFLLRMLRDKSVQVRIDGSGVYWRRWGDQPIPFRAIADDWTLTIHKQQMLCLALKEPELYPARSALLRSTAKANRAIGAGDVAISMTGLDRSDEELFEAYRAWSRTMSNLP